MVVLLFVIYIKRQTFSNMRTEFDSYRIVAMSFFGLLAIRILLNIGRILHNAE